MEDLNKILQTITIDILSTGDFISQQSQNYRLEQSELKATRDLVTEIDLAAEKKLVEACKNVLPSAGFIAEESGMSHENKKYVWVIDPLDGTTNFAHGVPHFGISVGLMYEGKTVIGIVYDVMKCELFTAIEGQGSFLNGRPIEVSKTVEWGSSLIATGFPPPRIKFNTAWFKMVQEIIEHTHGIRRMGAACLDLAYVACGRYEAFYEVGLNPWDVAAGALIVTEAGGIVQGFLPSDDYLFDGKIIAGNPVIHSELKKRIQTNSE